MPKLLLDDGETCDLEPKTGRKNFNFSGAIERASADENDSRRVRVVVTTEEPDRVGDIIVTSGIKVENYRANPVVLLQHRADSPIARCVELDIKPGKMEAVAEFPAAGVDAQADRVLGLIRANVLNAVSIGVNPLEGGVEWVDARNPFKGMRYTLTEMLEFSFVALPMNPSALILRRALGEVPEDEEIALYRYLANPPAAAPEIVPPVPEPACVPDENAALMAQARLRSVQVLRRRFV